MDIATQLGGAYRPSNHALFEVKKRLSKAGVYVSQPINDDFIISNKQAYCYDPTLTRLKDIELDLLKSIATCDVHIVCNEVNDVKGYIGQHTADGMLYALLKNKPIILLHKPDYRQKIEHQALEILRLNEFAMTIADLQKLSEGAIVSVVKEATHLHKSYSLNKKQKTFLHKHAKKLIAQFT